MNEKSLKIINFWNWFYSISNDLYINTKNANLINELDHQISSLGQFDWEIGPVDDSKSFYLAVSPKLNKELLQETKLIVSFSKICHNWVFLYAKPSKGWVSSWRMINESNEIIEINADSWVYELNQFEDKTFDIEVKVSSINGDLDTVQLAIEIAITNLLGEEKFIDLINSITFADIDNLTDLDKYSAFKFLDKHITELI